MLSAWLCWHEPRQWTHRCSSPVLLEGKAPALQHDDPASQATCVSLPVRGKVVRLHLGSPWLVEPTRRWEHARRRTGNSPYGDAGRCHQRPSYTALVTLPRFRGLFGVAGEQ